MAEAWLVENVCKNLDTGDLHPCGAIIATSAKETSTAILLVACDTGETLTII